MSGVETNKRDRDKDRERQRHRQPRQKWRLLGGKGEKLIHWEGRKVSWKAENTEMTAWQVAGSPELSPRPSIAGRQ